MGKKLFIIFTYKPLMSVGSVIMFPLLDLILASSYLDQSV
jgi:hypothetical protein